MASRTRRKDLNLVRIEDHDAGTDRALRDPGVQRDAVEVHFRDLIPGLVGFIRAAPAVVGCCAWLTHPEVLRALAARETVSIVVNKEDFLRPDTPGHNGKLHGRYAGLPGSTRLQHEPTSGLSYACDETLEAVRCVGYGGKDSARPRLHHKFFVALTRCGDPGDPGELRPLWVPEAVWTGSLNPTYNGGRSLENAVVIRDPVVARGFYEEWGQAVALSEPLDWSSEWVAPTWRLGT